MKKLMIALGALVSTLAVHAATAQWAAQYTAAATQGLTPDNYTMYFYSGEFDGKAASLSGENALDSAGFVWEDPEAHATMKTGDQFFTTADKTPIDYQLILVKNGTEWAVASSGTYTPFGEQDEPNPLVFSGNSKAITGKYSDASKNYSWSTLQTVPEPTSALLLLLGVAGLALKRRRA